MAGADLLVGLVSEPIWGLALWVDDEDQKYSNCRQVCCAFLPNVISIACVGSNTGKNDCSAETSSLQALGDMYQTSNNYSLYLVMVLYSGRPPPIHLVPLQLLLVHNVDWLHGAGHRSYFTLRYASGTEECNK